MRDYQDVLARFRGSRRVERPGTWHAFCPLHKGGEERSRSLSLWLGRDNRLLVRCWSCGSGLTKDILACVGLTMADLFDDDDFDGTRAAKGEVRRRVVETYDYKDEAGCVLYRVFRYEPKGFSQGRPDPSGGKKDGDPHWHGFAPGLGGVRRVLYRLPEIARADPKMPVFVVEGERKVALLESWGLLATCNAGGAGGATSGEISNWRNEYSRALSGRRVVLAPDNDEPGYRHADAACGSLVRHGAAEVRVLLLPGLPPKGDVLDFAKDGGTKERFLELAKSAPCYKRQ